MDFKVNQVVRCIETNPVYTHESAIKMGELYIVTEIREIGGHLVVRSLKTNTECFRTAYRNTWAARRFKPL